MKKSCKPVSPAVKNGQEATQHNMHPNPGTERPGQCTPQEQEMVKCEIESTDRQIDTLVYALDRLTEDEIKVAEAG